MLVQTSLGSYLVNVLCNFVCDCAENLEDDRDKDVELNENDEHPEGDEVEVDPSHTLFSHHEYILIDCDVPVVDNHLMEQHDQGRPKIVEVKRVVESRGITFSGCLLS